VSQNHPIAGRAWPELDRRRFLRLSGTAGAGVLLGGRASPAGAAAPTPIPGTPPRSRAIVIGVNEYENARKLENPVRDACRFAEWLVKKAGLRPADVALLTSPSPLPAGITPVAGIDVTLAKRKNLLKVIREFPNRAGERERLYFYYSGHGTAFQPRALKGTFDELDAVVPCDYDLDGPAPIPINWILDALRASPFLEQFFFFDACRNLARAMPQGGGEAPDLLPGPIPVQYILFATAPRRVTLDAKTGSFSEWVLSALNQGKGSSALFDGSRYLVRWDSLAGFVSQQFRKHPVILGADDQGRPIVQQPERDVIKDLGGEYPWLVALGPGEVAQVKLTIQVLPATVRPNTRITVTAEDGSVVVDRAPAPAKQPYEKRLSPGNYTALVEISDPSVRRFSPTLDLTEDRKIRFTVETPQLAGVPAKVQFLDETSQLAALSPITPGGGEATPVPAAAPIPVGAAAAPITVAAPIPVDDRGQPRAGPVPAADSATASLTVRAADQSDLVELVDAGGTPVRRPDGRPGSSLGSLRMTGLKPGIYRARVYPQAGQVIERIVPLAAGVHEVVNLGHRVAAAPAPPAAAAALPPGLLPPIPDGQGGMRPKGPEPGLVDARDLGQGPFRDPQGLRVLVRVARNAAVVSPEALASLKVSLGRLDDGALEPWPGGKAQGAGVAAFTVGREPGPYRLRVERPGEPVEFALTILPERLTEVILDLEVGGQILVSQFLPKAPREGPREVRTFFQLARIERALQGGQSRSVPALLDQLRGEGVAEPMVLVLWAYLAALGGRPEQLGEAGALLVERFPDLPDGHVARARSLEGSRRHLEAKLAYHAALERGLPVLALFLKFLDGGIKRLKFDHRRIGRLRTAARDQIPGLLWSAWGPPRAPVVEKD